MMIWVYIIIDGCATSQYPEKINKGRDRYPTYLPSYALASYS